MIPAIPLIVGLAVTGTATYFLSPSQGSSRRAAARERISQAASRLGISKRGPEELSVRAQRLAGDVREFSRNVGFSDETVARQVRQVVQGSVRYPKAVGVVTNRDEVLLHGEVMPGERETLIRRVREVAGARRIADHLVEREGSAENEAYQFEVSRRTGWKRHVDLRQEQWTPVARIATGLVGAGLVAHAGRHRTLLSALGGLAGGSLVVRSAVNKPLKQMGSGQGMIDVHKSIVVHAPVERVFNLIEAYENYPSFMASVREVRREAGGRSHWVVAGPAGSKVEWDSIITVHRPDEMLGWRSVPGSQIEHSGLIRFERLSDEETRVDISVSYRPPAGPLGHAVAKLFRADPNAGLDADLSRLKRLAESWEEWKSAVESRGPMRESMRSAAGESLTPQRPEQVRAS